MNEWVRLAGTTADDEYDTRIQPGGPSTGAGSEGWHHTGLLVTDLAAGESRTVQTGEQEWIVVPLSGSANVEVEGVSYELAGRVDVFSAATDVLYVPRDSAFSVTSTDAAATRSAQRPLAAASR